jgi:hypothetical protein
MGGKFVSNFAGTSSESPEDDVVVPSSSMEGSTDEMPSETVAIEFGIAGSSATALPK